MSIQKCIHVGHRFKYLIHDISTFFNYIRRCCIRCGRGEVNTESGWVEEDVIPVKYQVYTDE